MVLGLLLLGLALRINPLLAAWMSPVLLGLVLAPALVMASGSAGLGLWLQRRGILATPPEDRPGPVLQAVSLPPPPPGPVLRVQREMAEA